MYGEYGVCSTWYQHTGNASARCHEHQGIDQTGSPSCSEDWGEGGCLAEAEAEAEVVDDWTGSSASE